MGGGALAVIVAFSWYNFGMPSKKHPKSRLIVKRRGKDFSKPADTAYLSNYPDGIFTTQQGAESAALRKAKKIH